MRTHRVKWVCPKCGDVAWRSKEDGPPRDCSCRLLADWPDGKPVAYEVQAVFDDGPVGDEITTAYSTCDGCGKEIVLGRVRPYELMLTGEALGNRPEDGGVGIGRRRSGRALGGVIPVMEDRT